MATRRIDPRIFLPPVEGYEYRGGAGAEENDSSVELDLPPSSAPGLQPPSQVYVVDQIFRKGPDGRTVVDLVIEVEPVAGATEYEVRVAAE